MSLFSKLPYRYSLEDQVVNLLKNLQRNGVLFTINWDTGGGEQIFNFDFSDENYYSKCQRYSYDNLKKHIIDKFKLPNDGEYYNDGVAKLSLDENDKVLITYSEIGHYENYLEEYYINDITIDYAVKINFDKLKILKFNGSFSNLPIAPANFFFISKKISISESIQKEIENLVYSQFYKNPILSQDYIMLSFSGEINESHIIINDISYYKYIVVKYNENKVEYLF
ncbi:hypothetical protein [Chondrinema litorale]|uniref:hypothetical protein n=1 Tax=Chondrinema litorale TaxID=2994555 RepID=UPI0025434088|nr:hypothetical protein [Chondrinema litorale]UZR98166.1 hypothetical protein OQ292_29650 [Chondrinema litorale]